MESENRTSRIVSAMKIYNTFEWSAEKFIGECLFLVAVLKPVIFPGC